MGSGTVFDSGGDRQLLVPIAATVIYFILLAFSHKTLSKRFLICANSGLNSLLCSVHCLTKSMVCWDACVENSGFKEISLRPILRAIFIGSISLNGTSPVNNSKRITPKEYTSDLNVYGSFIC
ncbi:hypothetical protein BpHYR1_041230 [Brachionus plicatilis]|uniref:Uncharacterized protein n=1 Tax=Brachionus plicatilis TaxID=10195 RepID=A0A3M7PR74_BRAPC|nr:hypothetical protein BpHYR1_041230 [Brachionus plicatilis]